MPDSRGFLRGFGIFIAIPEWPASRVEPAPGEEFLTGGLILDRGQVFQ